MTWVTSLVVAVGVFILARTLLLAFAAEFGRKRDLVKHTARAGTDFHIAIIIPYRETAKLGTLQQLLSSLEKQDYPSERLGIHVIATQDSAFGFPQDKELAPNVKIWTYPQRQAPQGELISWAVERLIAAGGPTKLFAFLAANDIVHADYVKNITARAYDCFAMQGYVALKRSPKGILGYIFSLMLRILNRVENAGQFHAGLSARLMTSGWVVRQELLEMIPFHQGTDIDNLEYTLLLALHGYRVHWVPNVVVYRDEKISFQSIATSTAHSFLNRIRLVFQYTPRLFLKGLRKFDFGLLDQAWCTLKPPTWVIGLIGIMGSIIAFITPAFWEFFNGWALFTLAFISTQLVTIAVARFSLKDILFYALVAPILYLASLTLFPIVLIVALGEDLFHVILKPKRPRIGLRFDETQPPQPIANSTHNVRWPTFENALPEEVSLSAFLKDQQDKPRKTFLFKEKVPDLFDSLQETTPSNTFVFTDSAETKQSSAENTFETTYTLPISNGKQSILCQVKMIQKASLQEPSLFYYRLVLEYKALSFKTNPYPKADQAYDELETRLKEKGFTIVSCGSCAYFYCPGKGNPYGFDPEVGVCLYGKQSQDLHTDLKTITVVSESCNHYTDRAQRNEVIQVWQESLKTTVPSIA